MLPPRPLAPVLCANNAVRASPSARDVAVELEIDGAGRAGPPALRRRTGHRRNRRRHPRSARTGRRPGRRAWRWCRSASNVISPPLPLLADDRVTTVGAAAFVNTALPPPPIDCRNTPCERTPARDHVAGVLHRECAAVAAGAVRCRPASRSRPSTPSTLATPPPAPTLWKIMPSALSPSVCDIAVELRGSRRRPRARCRRMLPKISCGRSGRAHWRLRGA